jgi:hypothetical protein
LTGPVHAPSSRSASLTRQPYVEDKVNADEEEQSTVDEALLSLSAMESNGGAPLLSFFCSHHEYYDSERTAFLFLTDCFLIGIDREGIDIDAGTFIIATLLATRWRSQGNIQTSGPMGLHSKGPIGRSRLVGDR